MGMGNTIGGNMNNLGGNLGENMGQMGGGIPSPSPATPGQTNGFPGWGGFAGNNMQGMDPTTQMGMQIGAQFVAAGGNYMQKNVSPYSISLVMDELTGFSLYRYNNGVASYLVHRSSWRLTCPTVM